MSASLIVEDLTVSYSVGSNAIRNVSIEVPPESVCVVLGANGAGKTTLLRGIGGFWRSERGRVRGGRVLLDGEDVTGRLPSIMAKKGVILVPEANKVFSTLSVGDNMRAVPRKGNPGDLARELEAVLELFPVLAHRERQIAGLLSGGERQMLGIARALLLRPRLLMIDEASMGLSPIAVRQVFERLREVVARWDTSLLLVEQNVGAALSVATQVFVMEGGRVAFRGTPDEVMADDRIQRTYLGLE